MILHNHFDTDFKILVKVKRYYVVKTIIKIKLKIKKQINK